MSTITTRDVVRAQVMSLSRELRVHPGLTVRATTRYDGDGRTSTTYTFTRGERIVDLGNVTIAEAPSPTWGEYFAATDAEVGTEAIVVATI